MQGRLARWLGYIEVLKYVRERHRHAIMMIWGRKRKTNIPDGAIEGPLDGCSDGESEGSNDGCDEGCELMDG